MKRFWKNAEAIDGAILLDGRPVKTPTRNPLIVPTPLIDEIVREWNAQGEEVDPRSMPFTGLANAAIDRVSTDPATFAESLARYAEADLLCYRADEPPPLVAKQAESWDPLLAWARSRFDVHFELITGIMHRDQPKATVERLSAAIHALDPFTLAAMSPLVTISGSLIVALALIEGRVTAEDAFDISHLDELWQAEQWGEDAQAKSAREARRHDFLAAAQFARMVLESPDREASASPAP